MSDAILTVTNLSVSIEGTQVLHSITLRVEPGEAVAIIGRNGSGKTTLFRALVGQLSDIDGMIDFEGLSLINLSPHKAKSLGLYMVAQGSPLYSSLDVLSNIQLAHSPTSGLNWREVAEAAIRRIPGLATLMFRPAKSLSGGERQMVGLVRAVAAQPKLLLLDEPSLGLAPDTVASLEQLISELTAEGTAILLSEQDLNLVKSVCSRVYVIEGGRIYGECKTPDDEVCWNSFLAQFDKH
ncbi:MAG: ATP-binding cassette domain-containing protein [Fimbriimonadaceae bacterium]|nr:ATP-binding cassette domain-containing protein [Fimbriimonadaceae bacterium]